MSNAITHSVVWGLERLNKHHALTLQHFCLSGNVKKYREWYIDDNSGAEFFLDFSVDLGSLPVTMCREIKWTATQNLRCTDIVHSALPTLIEHDK